MSTNTPPTVAVVGAGGFIGRRLADTLDAAGVPTARLTRSTPLLAGGGPVAAIAGSDVIFYLATSINPALAERHPERVASDRSTFASVLDALRLTGRRPWVVLASSAGAVYDPAGTPPYRESDPAHPVSAYGRAKLDLERILLDARDVARPVVLRIANAYGPGQRTGTMQGVIGHWLAAAVTGAPLRLYGDPDARRDYVFVDDVVEAILHAARLSRTGSALADPEIFNIGSGEPVSLGELALLVQEMAHRTLPIEYLSARQFDRRDVWFEVGKAREILCWHPRTRLADGIRRTWHHLTAAPGVSHARAAAPPAPVRSSP